MQINWSRKALLQLDIIIKQCVDLFGERIAIRFYRQLSDYEKHLSENPLLGPPEPLLQNRKRNYRGLIIHDHFKLIYYITNKGIIQIADMWDTRREPAKLAKRIK